MTLRGNLRFTNCIFSANQRWLVSVWYLFEDITRYGLTTGVKSNSWSVQLTALERCIRRCNYLSIRCEIAADLTGSIHLMPVSFPLHRSCLCSLSYRRSVILAPRVLRAASALWENTASSSALELFRRFSGPIYLFLFCLFLPLLINFTAFYRE